MSVRDLKSEGVRRGWDRIGARQIDGRAGSIRNFRIGADNLQSHSPEAAAVILRPLGDVTVLIAAAGDGAGRSGNDRYGHRSRTSGDAFMSHDLRASVQSQLRGVVETIFFFGTFPGTSCGHFNALALRENRVSIRLSKSICGLKASCTQHAGRGVLEAHPTNTTNTGGAALGGVLFGSAFRQILRGGAELRENIFNPRISQIFCCRACSCAPAQTPAALKNPGVLSCRWFMRFPFPVCFITGTDTGVGKTIIAGAIANWFYRRGRRRRCAQAGRDRVREAREGW